MSAFFSGEEGSQYFIKPLQFESAKSKEKMDADFTFRDRPKDSSMIANFSLLSKKELLNPSQIMLVSSDANDTVIFELVNQIYSEKRNDLFVNRIATKAKKSAITKLILQKYPTFIVKFQKEDIVFKPTKTSLNSLEKLRKRLIL